MIPDTLPDLSEAAKNAVLTRGTSIDITTLDGRSETVKVRMLPQRLMPDYQAIVENEAQSIELFCAKPAGWADTLELDSHVAILAAGEALNLDPLSRYCARARARREKIMPGLESQLLRAITDKATGTLPTS